MFRFFYNLLLLLALPFIVLRLLVKSLSMPAYRQNMGQRFGNFTWAKDVAAHSSDSKTIWIHAVSVGETAAAAPLVKKLQQLDPIPNIVLTTTTPTGADHSRSLFGDSVAHSYSPYDLGFVVRRFLNKLQPDLLILMETELWPNILQQCQNKGVAVLLANGRLSEKSAAGYRKIAGLSQVMLQQVSHIAAQAQADADRFIALGANSDKVSVTGSLKFSIDGGVNAENDALLFQSIRQAGRQVVIAASTRDGEEAKVLSAMATVWQQKPETLLLLVPRHPQRFDKVAELCRDRELKLQRRSEADHLDCDTQVVLGDSMGEMHDYYAMSDIAFVGGSLVDTGCQNVLEPAAIGIPVVVGPSQFNFAVICAMLEESGALQTVSDSAQLGKELLTLLGNDEQRSAMGNAGRVTVERNQQALPLLMKQIGNLLT